MMGKRILALLALCVLMTLVLGISSDTALAQDNAKSKNVDKSVATRKGVKGSLADGKKDEEAEGPSKTQMAIGVGSIFVMIAVMKWL